MASPPKYASCRDMGKVYRQRNADGKYSFRDPETVTIGSDCKEMVAVGISLAV